MTKMLDEIHPGEILLEEFMKPKEIPRARLPPILMCHRAESATS